MSDPTLTEALAEACARWADRPALFAAGQSLSYGQLDKATRSLALGYRRLGLVPGDRVVCQLPNRSEHLISACASWQVRAIHVGIDLDLAPRELGSLLARIRPALVVVDEARADAIAALGTDVVSPELRVMVVGDASHGHLSMSRTIEESSPEAMDESPAWPLPEDPALIFFTSGTTGAPKGVIRLHGQLRKGWQSVATALPCGPDDVHLGQLPLSHGFGFGMAVMALLSGGKLILEERFSPEEALQLIDEHRVSVLHGTPTHFALLTQLLDQSHHDVASVRVGMASAAAFPPKLLQQIFECFDMKLALCYGSSEGLGWATVDREEMLAGSVGSPPPEMVRIVGTDGRSVGPGALGEILLRAVHPVRYWDEPESAQRPDWYHTGDLGRLDASGRLYVLGRMRDQVVRGGITVDLGEVDSALSRHPGLADAAAVGMSDAVLGEVVCACVVPVDKPPNLEELRQFLRDFLGRHKLPDQLCVVKEIPRTCRGKLDRKALTQVVATAAVVERLR